MVKIEKSSESTAVPQVSAARPSYKIMADQRLRDIIIDNVQSAVSEYGPFMAMNCTAGDGEEFSLVCGITTVWGRNCIETFADATDLGEGEMSYTLKEKFIGRKVWIGKKSVESTKKKGKIYLALEWGYET